VSRGSSKSGLSRAVAVLASLLLGTGAALGAAGGGTAWAAPAAATRAADPPPTPAADIKTALGIGNVPAELVFLVDVSQSMGQNGLYSDVQDQLPNFLDTLSQQEPQDYISVITFAGRGTAQVIYTGSPTSDIGLPADANNVGTDFGQAFDLAISQLSPPHGGAKVGGVVMLSDGQLWAPSDDQYKSFDAPGWEKLKTKADNLPIAITGYAVPLTTNKTYIANQVKALSAVFTRHQTLPQGTTDLAGALSAAGQGVLNSEVTQAVSGDSHRGIQVTWNGLPGAGGQPLDLTSPGHRDVTVTLTDTAGHVPLYVTGLHLTAPGLPFTVTGLPAAETIKPGHPVRVPVRLTWSRHSAGCTPWHTSGCSLTGSPQRLSGRLILTGAVGSTWTPALRSAFDDMDFAVGALSGNNAGFTAASASTGVFMYLLFLLLILAALAGLLLMRALLHGTLILSSVDERSGPLPLGPWPVQSDSTATLIDLPGQITVHGRPFRRGMKIKLELDGRPASTAELEPGGRTMLAGIDIVHTRERVHQPHPAYGRRY
jgi:Mg-chelatase subunit ChlD